MNDEIKTATIQNPRKIVAPEPPKPGILGSADRAYPAKAETVSDPSKAETEIEALKRRVAALEHALNGRTSE